MSKIAIGIFAWMSMSLYGENGAPLITQVRIDNIVLVDVVHCDHTYWRVGTQSINHLGSRRPLEDIKFFSFAQPGDITYVKKVQRWLRRGCSNTRRCTPPPEPGCLTS